MRSNGIEVCIEDANEQKLKEIRALLQSGESDKIDKCHIEVTPGGSFTVRVRILEYFKWAKQRTVFIDCAIDGNEVYPYTPDLRKIQKPSDFKYGKYALDWMASRGEFNCRGLDTDYLDFAFGRDMDEFRRFVKKPEKFSEQGKICIRVSCGKETAGFEFQYATTAILKKEGILRSSLAQSSSKSGKHESSEIKTAERSTISHAQPGSGYISALRPERVVGTARVRRANGTAQKVSLDPSKAAKPSGIKKKRQSSSTSTGGLSSLLALASTRPATWDANLK